jgi:hypothetical protein
MREPRGSDHGAFIPDQRLIDAGPMHIAAQQRAA